MGDCTLKSGEEWRRKQTLKESQAAISSVLIKTPLPLATQEPQPALSRIHTKKSTSSYIVVKLLGSEDTEKGSDDQKVAWLTVKSRVAHQTMEWYLQNAERKKTVNLDFCTQWKYSSVINKKRCFYIKAQRSCCQQTCIVINISGRSWYWREIISDRSLNPQKKWRAQGMLNMCVNVKYYFKV